MREKLQNLKNEALAQIIQSTDSEELERLRVHYLGKSGQLAQLAKGIPSLEKEIRHYRGSFFLQVPYCASNHRY